MGAQDSTVLRTRADGSTELRINGVFVMDDRETSSERLLADRALSDVVSPAVVLVGGLGLGYTVRAVLDHAGVERVVVVEIEPQIVTWMRDGRIPGADLLDDPRVDLRVADVRDVVAATANQSLEVILLDVDNGPDSLVLDRNADLYRPAFLAECARRLRRHGALFIWSQSDSPDLRKALAVDFEHVGSERVPVRLQARDEAYWLLHGAVPRHEPLARPDNLES